MMQDRIEFDGNIFKVITSENSGVITSDIIKVDKNGNEEHIYQFNIPSNNISESHTKAISILFKVLQEYKYPTKDNFKEYDNFENKNSIDSSEEITIEITDIDNNREFENICKEIASKFLQGCFLIKNNNLYSYIHQKNGLLNIEKINSYIENFFEILNRDNNRFNKIFATWHQIVQSFDNFHIYYNKLSNNTIFVTIFSSSLSMGQVMSMSDNYIDYLKDKNFI